MDTAQSPCKEFINDGGTRRCARCGWHRTAHGGSRSPLADALETLRREHVAVADNFYSCPKSAEGCDDPAWSADECSCGADEHNARLDALITRLTGRGQL